MNGDAVSESSVSALPMCVPEPSQIRAEVRRYFVGLGVVEGPGLERLVERVMARCQDLCGVAPASVAAWLLAGWVGDVLGREPGRDFAAAACQAAVLLADAGQRWPGCLLASGPVPEELSGALRAALPQPVPRPLPLAMPEQPLAPPAFAMPRRIGWGFGVEQRS